LLYSVCKWHYNNDIVYVNGDYIAATLFTAVAQRYVGKVFGTV